MLLAADTYPNSCSSTHTFASVTQWRESSFFILLFQAVVHLLESCFLDHVRMYVSVLDLKRKAHSAADSPPQGPIRPGCGTVQNPPNHHQFQDSWAHSNSGIVVAVFGCMSSTSHWIKQDSLVYSLFTKKLMHCPGYANKFQPELRAASGQNASV